MKIFFKVKYLFLTLFFLIFPKIYGEDYFLKNISNQVSQIIVGFNNQKSDLDNSIFYAEADVIINNNGKEFISKANNAIIYKSTGKIKFTGNVKVSTADFKKVRAAEMLFFLKEKKIEAISDLNQIVKIALVFNEDKITNRSRER